MRTWGVGLAVIVAVLGAALGAGVAAFAARGRRRGQQRSEVDEPAEEDADEEAGPEPDEQVNNSLIRRGSPLCMKSVSLGVKFQQRSPAAQVGRQSQTIVT